ncbi:MAG TPA: hypothetical protein VMV10_19190 [Pirellulales bacterium]|nr:hypothetical protein [Pirellulales bacterium]
MAGSRTIADYGRNLRSIRLALLTLAAGLSAFGLLRLGFTVGTSFGIAGGAITLVLARRSLIHFAGASCRRVAQLAVAIVRGVFDRRTYRFRLSTLLLTITIIAAVCAWYSHRLHEVRLEIRRLAGKWQMFNSRGEPLVLNGKPLIEDFEQSIRNGTCTIDPAHDPKWIDFHSSTGVSRGIYRWEGNRLRVAQSSENALRPTSFDPRHGPDVDPSAPPLPGGGWRVSCSYWIYEPAVEE